MSKNVLLLMIGLSVFILGSFLYLLFRNPTSTPIPPPASIPLISATPTAAQSPTSRSSANSQLEDFKKLPLKEQLNLQTQADHSYAYSVNNTFEKYPWIDKLPVNGDNYYIYFDLASGSFMADIYPKAASTEPEQKQAEKIKTQVLAALKIRGVDYQNYAINWKVKPEPK